MYNPKVKADVPAEGCSLLDRALGHDVAHCFESCDDLIEAFSEAIRRAEAEGTPTSMQETPCEGSVLLLADDTPADGHEAVAEPQADDGLPCSQLAHYRIIERIGGGGMGDVYRGYDESLEREVAIKILPAELARDEDFIRRFHAEAKAAAQVHHPNVLPVFFSGEHDGYHFFAMQVIKGESLSQRLARSEFLAVEEAIQVAEQCLEGLNAAHAQELIHRDVKPANILIDSQTGRAVLVDFGLVRRLGQSEQITATGVVMGTVDYMAPEQARGQPVDRRADIYSLGVLLYRMLSGRLPFEADTPTAMIFQHAYEEPFPLGEAASDAPQPIIDLVTRMMAKNPDDRYPDCQAVLADIQAYREDRPLADVEVHPGTQPSTAPSVLDPSVEPQLPEDLEELVEEHRRHRVRDWFATVFRRHAPELIQNLQSTTQQVDGVVAHYERHRQQLATLLEEARGIAQQLSEQLHANLEAQAAAEQEPESADGDDAEQATLPKMNACEENIEALRKQYEEQQQQVEEIEHQLGQVDAKLVQVCSQRDVLKARLRAAGAQRQLEGGRPRVERRRWVLLAAIVGAVILVASALFISLKIGKTDGASNAPPMAVAPFDAATAKQHQEAWAEHLGVPVECTNSLGMQFSLIPPGEFLMGSPEGEQQTVLEEVKAVRAGEPEFKFSSERLLAEGPQHQVRITRPFYMGVYEVMQAECVRVTGTNPSVFSPTGKGKYAERVRGMDTSRFPVETISWDEAVEFCRSLSDLPAEKSAGRVYRLATEAEWEYACRAGTTTPFYFGELLNGRKANYSGEDPHETETMGPHLLGRTTTVGSYQPNAFGLYDMHWNVGEWCQDWYSDVYYNYSPTEDPAGPTIGSRRMIRGGSWFVRPGVIRSGHRSASRYGSNPDSENSDRGFRLVLDLEEK